MSEPVAPAAPVVEGAAPARGRFSDAALAFAMGLALALLQYTFFFMLEVYLSSRATAFFIALFFWLIGFLAGLNVRWNRRFPLLLAAALGAYYTAFVLIRVFAYQYRVLPLVGACISVGGMLAGGFFPWAGPRFRKVKLLFFHENNGFIVGIVLSLVGSEFAGRWLLDFAPLAGCLPVAALLLLKRFEK